LLWVGFRKKSRKTHRPGEAKKLKRKVRQSAKVATGLAQAIALAIALVLCLALLGCGNAPTFATLQAPSLLADCGADGGKVQATDLVLLDWTGGVSAIYPEDDLPPFDLSLFATPEGTLLDMEEAFKAAIRDHVAAAMCDFPGVAVAVRTGEGPSTAPTSTVYITLSRSPNSRSQIGEGEYDPCNEQHDNDAIIYGEELLQLGGPYTFDEWVNIIGNVVAHETGHMLGFPHVAPTADNSGDRALYIELMLASHTINEMLSPQRFLAEDSNCPDTTAKTRLQPPSICEIRN